MEWMTSWIGLIVLAMIVVALAEPAAAAVDGQGRVILAIGTWTGNDGLRDWVIDPVLAEQLRREGWVIEERSTAEVTAEHLDAADVVVVVNQPYLTNLEGVKVFEKFTPLFDAYLKRGGGAVLFFDDYYFQMLPVVNKMTQPWGLEILKERLSDPNESIMHHLPTSPEMEVLTTTNLAEHPLTRDIDSLTVALGPNGASMFAFRADENWDIVVRGEKSTKSLASWTDNSSTYDSAPPMIAVRQFDGDGRLVFIPDHSSFSLLHGNHMRWGEGYFLKRGMGQLIRNALDWAADAPARAKGLVPPARLVGRDAQDEATFRKVPLAEQVPPPAWQKGTTVVLDAMPDDLASWREALAGKLDWVALAVPGDDMDAAGYEAWKARCAQASDETFAFIPGMRIIDSFNNPAVVLVPKKWPITRSLRSLNHISHDVNGHIILLSPQENPWPAWNIGGFWGFPLATYRAGKRVDFQPALLNRLQRYDWFLVPHAVDTQTDPKTLAARADRRGEYFTWVGVDSPLKVGGYLPQQHHNDRQIIASAGPMLKEFAMVGPSLIDDMYEGPYYLWAGPDDTGTLRASLACEKPIREVRIFRDALLWRRYQPGTKQWTLELELQSDQASRNYWIEAEDVDGNLLTTPPVRTRSLTYWSHGGGDRMNTYAALMVPRESGQFSIRGTSYAGCGGVLFGLGWGNWVSISAPYFAEHLTPVGREWGIPAFGMGKMLTIPRLRHDGKVDFAVGKPDRIGYELASEEVAIIDEHVERMEKPGDKARPVVPSNMIEADIRYTMPRTLPERGLSMIVEVTVTPKKPLTFATPGSLRILEMIANPKCQYRNLTLFGDEGIRRYALDDPALAKGIEGVQAGVFWPDITGNPSVVRLGGAELNLRVRLGRSPRFRWTTTIPAGTWRPDEPIRMQYAVVFDAGQDGPEARLALLHEVLSPARLQAGAALETGSARARAGTLRLATENGLAGGTITLPTLPITLLTSLDGVNPRSPQIWKDLTDGSVEPIASFGPAAYKSIDTRQVHSFLAGDLICCSSPEVQIDVKQWTDDRLDVWVHNPTAEAIEASVEPTALWPGRPQRVTLQPGEDRQVSFPASRADTAEVKE